MKIFKGKVISTKMKNTATVLVDNTIMHRLYGKRFTRSKKYHVHDEYGVKIGETVNFVASKPFSKIKKWKVVNYKAENRLKNMVPKEAEKLKGRKINVIQKKINKK
jgi:small subunit ribosomal protein S17